MQSTASTASAPLSSARLQQVSRPQPEQQEDFSELVSEVSTAVQRYCSRRPRVAAGCLFTLGFIVGWKMRPW